MPDDIGRIALNEGEAKYCLEGNGNVTGTQINRGNTFTTREAAERQDWINIHRQLARVAMAEDWGDVERDWEDNEQKKHTISVDGNFNFMWVMWHFLAFRTNQARNAFSNNYSEQEIIMIARGE